MSLYREYLNRIFFGYPPQHLLDTPDNLNSLAFAKQGMKYTWGEDYPNEIYELRFTDFILDIIKLSGIGPHSVPIPEEYRLLTSGIYVRGFVSIWLDDKKRSAEQKSRMCFFQRRLLETFTTVYRIKVIDNQKQYIKQLIKLENRYRSEVPKVFEATDEIRFKNLLSETQKTTLNAFLLDKGYVNSPQDFVRYLCGLHNGKNITVNPGSEEATCYLLYQLYQVHVLQLTKGKAYRRYLELTLCPFSLEKKEEHVKSLIRKVQRSISLKSSIGKDIDKFVKKLIS